MDFGIQMKVEIPSYSFTANALTDRLGAGPSTKHIDTRCKTANSVSRKFLQRTMVQILERSQSLLQYHSIAHV